MIVDTRYRFIVAVIVVTIVFDGCGKDFSKTMTQKYVGCKVVVYCSKNTERMIGLPTNTIARDNNNYWSN